MDYDVIVIGGGPAGLCFANAAARHGLRILVVERQPETGLSSPLYDGREIALTHLSKKIMQEYGLWDWLPDGSVSLVRHAKVMNGHSPYALSFDYTESGEDTLGFMVSNNRIRKAAYQAVKGNEAVDILCEREVTAVGTDERKAWVCLDDGKRYEASLVVAADSRFSVTRRLMGISCSMIDFGRSCIVCTMSIEKTHNDTACECFYFDRTLAVLPLNGNMVSVVVTVPSDQLDTVMRMQPQDFSAEITERLEGRFGMMSLTSDRFHYPLVASFAKTFCASRFALLGDAAVGMHPVTAHGFNLGLRGTKILADAIGQAVRSGQDFSSPVVLQRYDRMLSHVAKPLYHGTNALVGLYTRTTIPAKMARRALLRLGNICGPARRLIINQLTEEKAA